MIGIYADTLPIALKRNKTLQKARRWSNYDIQFLDVARATVRYRYKPSVSNSRRPTLAIIPDPPVMIEHYQELVDRLTETFNVLLFELPGFGFSIPKLGLSMAPEAVAKLISAFLDKVGKVPIF